MKKQSVIIERSSVDSQHFITFTQAKRGRKSTPSISFSQKNGHVRISACIARKNDQIDMQIDFQKKIIRIKKIKDESKGIRLHNGGVFTRHSLIKKLSFEELKTIRINLMENKDGWFYGSLEHYLR
nr:hypothetical protein [Klebsiella aerogenes]